LVDVDFNTTNFDINDETLVDNDENANNEEDNLSEDENSHDLIEELNSFDHEQEEFDTQLKDVESHFDFLSSYAAKNKNSINTCKFFIKKKARLRIENTTRWSSSFLILESFQKAILRDAFPRDKLCPVSLEIIETYLQILLPAFQMNLIMQKSKSTIAYILPTKT
ncbi:unnamed protein product, partial [Brachionus calyciflorus]